MKLEVVSGKLKCIRKETFEKVPVPSQLQFYHRVQQQQPFCSLKLYSIWQNLLLVRFCCLKTYVIRTVRKVHSEFCNVLLNCSFTTGQNSAAALSNCCHITQPWVQPWNICLSALRGMFIWLPTHPTCLLMSFLVVYGFKSKENLR